LSWRWFRRISVYHGYGFLYGFRFGAVFFVHNEVYHVKALAVGLAVGTKTVTRMRFVIDL
jgi:hypothetical protein